MSTIIRYFVPEDRDAEDKPNAFLIYKDQDKVRLSDIKEGFPLPGQYVFRFKTEYQKAKVWIDFDKEDEQIPLLDGKILMKVNRISWDKQVKNMNQVNSSSSDFPDFY
jgi:hypothetical protein